MKNTEIYSSDNAPINYLESNLLNKDDEREIGGETAPAKDPPLIALESVKPHKVLEVREDFLNSISQAYIQGKHSLKGNVPLRIKEIILLLVHNMGSYHVKVSPSLKKPLLDILQYGDRDVLGRTMTEYDRKETISLFKRDNI
jgi:hypothetical protein